MEWKRRHVLGLADFRKEEIEFVIDTAKSMEEILTRGDADFVALARPFIREPDLARQLANGRTGRVDCTSCNLCLMHESHHSLRCWRTPRRRLLQHALYRFSGGFKRGPTIEVR